MGYSSSKRLSFLGTTEMMALIFLFLKIHFMRCVLRAKIAGLQIQSLLLLRFDQIRQVFRGDNRTNLLGFIVTPYFESAMARTESTASESHPSKSFSTFSGFTSSMSRISASRL